MKKAILALACACLASTAFAEKSIRIINTDPVNSITISQLENCTQVTTKYDPAHPEKPSTITTTCTPMDKVTLSNLTGKANYTDIKIGDDSEDETTSTITFLHVFSATSTNASSTFGKKDSDLVCEGDVTGDAIALNTYNTNHILCNSREINSSN